MKQGPAGSSNTDQASLKVLSGMQAWQACRLCSAVCLAFEPTQGRRGPQGLADIHGWHMCVWLQLSWPCTPRSPQVLYRSSACSCTKKGQTLVIGQVTAAAGFGLKACICVQSLLTCVRPGTQCAADCLSTGVAALPALDSPANLQQGIGRAYSP